jgi:hypothetical protein
MEINYYKLLDSIIGRIKADPNSMSDSMIQEEVAKPLANSSYNSERDFPALWKQLKDDGIVIQVIEGGNWRLSVKGLSFSYVKEECRKTMTSLGSLISSISLAGGTLGLLIFEMWKFYQEHWACCGCTK